MTEGEVFVMGGENLTPEQKLMAVHFNKLGCPFELKVRHGLCSPGVDTFKDFKLPPIRIDMPVESEDLRALRLFFKPWQRWLYPKRWRQYEAMKVQLLDDLFNRIASAMYEGPVEETGKA